MTTIVQTVNHYGDLEDVEIIEHWEKLPKYEVKYMGIVHADKSRVYKVKKGMAKGTYVVAYHWDGGYLRVLKNKLRRVKQ